MDGIISQYDDEVLFEGEVCFKDSDHSAYEPDLSDLSSNSSSSSENSSIYNSKNVLKLLEDLKSDSKKNEKILSDILYEQSQMKKILDSSNSKMAKITSVDINRWMLLFACIILVLFALYMQNR